mgnify:CR=1 FL=1
MIDADGFRANVGIVICNKMGQVFWARRYGQHSWQFPQGGIDTGESQIQAAYRELFEEVGIKKTQVKVVQKSSHWYHYDLPEKYQPRPKSLKNFKVDFTFVNLVSEKNMIQRLKKRKKLNRYDNFKKNFYKKVQNGYLKLSKENKKKYMLINSNLDFKINKDLVITKINQLIR